MSKGKKKDPLLDFLRRMHKSEEYLRMDNLKDNYSYKIFARNAYVGIWIEHEKSFLIARYKAGPNPYLFKEHHWDSDPKFGTVKPLKVIEKCPIVTSYNGSSDKRILSYLENLEEQNPIINGFNSLQDRKNSAIRFSLRLSTPPSANYKFVSEKIKSELLPKLGTRVISDE
jgi:hypothetical protein